MEKTKAQKIKSRHASKGVEVKRSKLGGLGLFATRDFKKGEFIIEYIGEKLTTAEADRRGGKVFIYFEQTLYFGWEVS
jgi:SET domain-containing protein